MMSPGAVHGTYYLKKRRSSKSNAAGTISPKGKNHKLVNHSKSFRIDKKKFANRADNDSTFGNKKGSKAQLQQEKLFGRNDTDGGQIEANNGNSIQLPGIYK